MEEEPDFSHSHFNGSDYDPALDDPRLRTQIDRVFRCMVDKQWRTLGEIAALTRDPEASISAQLRHLRKERFGSYRVLKRRHPSYAEEVGLFQYRLLPPKPPGVEVDLII